MSHSPPKLGQLNIVSADLEASVSFYRRLGVEIPEERVWRTETGAHHASATNTPGDQSLDLDVDSTAFAQVWNTGWKGRSGIAGRVVVGFRVPSRERVDEIYADMTAAGHVGLQPPYDAFWGARYAVLEDPDGIAVGLMSPMSKAMGSAPPSV
jgi:catechol 2,3-dioxygenase-like lactoylglutathione lyase family enzyme